MHTLGNQEKLNMHRVITMLDRNEMDFLDKMGKDALFSTGHKLSYSEILKGLIDFAMEAGVSGQNIHSLQELKNALAQRLIQLAQAKGVGNEKTTPEGNA